MQSSIATTKRGAEALQAADDRAANLPAPGSRGDPPVNLCSACGARVAGPETRYRCLKCGLTADQYDAPCRHVEDPREEKGAWTYPATETAIATVDAAKAKPEKDRTAVEKDLAASTTTVAAEPAREDEVIK